MHVLHAPAAADELGGQPVEQFGMRRALAHDAEIAGRADDAAAEVIMPDAIDHDARGQRIVGVGEPLRQRGAAAGRFDIRRAARSSRAFGSSSVRKPGCTSSRGRIVDADGENVGRRRGAAEVGHAHALGQLAGIDVVELREFACAARRIASSVRPSAPWTAVFAARFPDTASPSRTICAFVGRALGGGLQDRRLDLGRVLVEVLLGGCLAVGLDKRGDLRADVGLVFSSQTARLRAVLGDCVGGEHRDVIVGRGVGEEGLEAVVVGLQDRIELVIVAAGAAEGQAEEDRAGGVGDVVEDLLAALLQIRARCSRRGSGG